MTCLFSAAVTTGTLLGTAFRYARRNISRAISCQANLTGTAASGTSANVYVQSSVDNANWFDVVSFTQMANTPIRMIANATNQLNQNAVTAGDAAMGAGSTPINVIGDRLRIKVVIVGTYTGTNLQVDVFSDQLEVA